MGKNQLEKKRSPKSRRAILEKMKAVYFEREGHTVAQLAVDVRRTVRAQLKETEELRRTERLGGKEAVVVLELQLSGLTLSKAKLKLERDMLFEIFCLNTTPCQGDP